MTLRRLRYLLLVLLLLLWACGGVSRGPEGTWHNFSEADGLLDSLTWAIAVDELGNVWAGTSGGLNIIRPDGTIAVISDSHAVGNLLIDDHERVWAFTCPGGVSRYDGSTSMTFTTANSDLPSDCAWEAALDEQNNLWILHHDAGLSVIRNDDTIEHIGFPPWPGYDVEGQDGAIAVDRSGRVWIGAGSRGYVVRYDPRTGLWETLGYVHEHFPEIPPHRQFIWAMAADERDDMWVCAQRVIEIEGEQWQLHRDPCSRPPAFTCLLIEANGSIWFGTIVRGVMVLSSDNETWWQYSTSNSGLIDDSVNDIAYDPQTGSYWFATMDGVSQFTPTR